MKIRKIILFSIMAFALLSCDNITFKTNNSNTNSSGGNNVNLEGYLIKASYPKIDINHDVTSYNDFKSFLDSLDTFASRIGTELYSNDQNKDTRNICVSPLSIYMALALGIESSKDETRQELLDAIGVTYDDVKIYTKYIYSLSNRDYSTKNENGELVELYQMLKNSVWSNNIGGLKDSGLDALAEHYNSDIYHAPFASNNKLANKLVHDYIYENTNGLIDLELNLSESTLFLLMNVLYLKDIWNTSSGDLSKTSEEYDFVNTDGSITKTPLLTFTREGRVYEEESFKHFVVNTMNGFKIKFIVPNDGYSVEDVFTVDNLKTINSIKNYHAYENDTSYLTRCYFPEFEASYNSDIKDILKESFNINYLFDRGACDFGNITDLPSWCSSIIHATQLNTTYQGIEGAAVTILVNDAESAGPDNIVIENFVIDRSFGFILTDYNNITLFSGVVNNI